MKTIFKFLQSIFLQLILSVIAIGSFQECQELGSKNEVGTYIKTGEGHYETIGTSIDAGYKGGALGMGIICSVCIIMIVWLEINKKLKS